MLGQRTITSLTVKADGGGGSAPSLSLDGLLTKACSQVGYCLYKSASPKRRESFQEYQGPKKSHHHKIQGKKSFSFLFFSFFWQYWEFNSGPCA
jgi:hypothetical protein